MTDLPQTDLTRLMCLNCQALHDANDLYCSQCGCILGHTLKGADKTNLLGSAATATGATQRIINLEWGTSYFHPRAQLSLYHIDLRQTIPIPLTGESIVIGRNVENDKGIIDLTLFSAAEYGVSRRHVRIARIRDFLQVTDLNSSNGTFLNRAQLMQNVGYTLRNRAVLQLGHMVLRVQFS